VTLPANASPAGRAQTPPDSPIAGSVLPIQRAEELLATLPGVLSAKIIASSTGAIEEIHLLTTEEVAPKQTVRNVESALIAHLGLRVSHKKISVASTSETRERMTPAGGTVLDRSSGAMAAIGAAPDLRGRRVLLFEDIEVRRSRTKGVAVRVTLRRGDEQFVGEAEGVENERLRMELAARATLSAIAACGESRTLGLEGCKQVEAFEREFVFVGVTARYGRESALLTGSAEVKESPETSAVLAVLDATNRWMELGR
jgi:hypothetical protein